MNKRLNHLAQERTRLLAKTVVQRTALKATLQPLHKPFRMVDQVMDKARHLRSHPLWALVPVIGSVGYMLLRRGRFMPKLLLAGALVQRVKRLTQIYNVAQPYWRQFLESRALAKNNAAMKR